MTTPFIFIGTHRIKPGKREAFKQYFAHFSSDVVEPAEPRLHSLYGYTAPDSAYVTIVQMHPDADSMMTPHEGRHGALRDRVARAGKCGTLPSHRTRGSAGSVGPLRIWEQVPDPEVAWAQMRSYLLEPRLVGSSFPAGPAKVR